MTVVTQTFEKHLDVRTTPLDDILTLPFPTRSQALEQFLDDPWGDGDVLLKANDGKNLQVSIRGMGKLQFGPKGRRVRRRLAITLLQDFGKDGTYYNRDQATGMTETTWRGMSENQKGQFEGVKFNFLKQYLTHIPDVTDEGRDNIITESIESYKDEDKFSAALKDIIPDTDDDDMEETTEEDEG